MISPFHRYSALEDDLVYVRWVHQGLESAAEDELLEEMDEVWAELSASERESIEAMLPRSIIRGNSLSAEHRRMVDIDIAEDAKVPSRTLQEAA
ncbi:MAG: hypothetical protein ACI9OJ_002443 [Myxococcota bacterium]|jgi:hypothetical protein